MSHSQPYLHPVFHQVFRELRKCHVTARFTSCFSTSLSGTQEVSCHSHIYIMFFNKSFRNLGSVMSQPYLHPVFHQVFQELRKCHVTAIFTSCFSSSLSEILEMSYLSHIYIMFFLFFFVFLASLWEASCHSPINYHFSTRLWGSGMSQPYYCTSYLHLVFQHIFAEELNQFQIQLWLCFVLFGFCSLTSPPLHGLPLLLLQASNN